MQTVNSCAINPSGGVSTGILTYLWEGREREGRGVRLWGWTRMASSAITGMSKGVWVIIHPSAQITENDSELATLSEVSIGSRGEAARQSANCGSSNCSR